MTEPNDKREFDDLVAHLEGAADGDADTAAPIDLQPRQTQMDIVRRQFRKNRAAVWGMRVTMTLIIVATFAPAIASSQPFVWKNAANETEFPWFTKLFDVITWPYVLDRVFNLLMLVSVLYGICMACVWLVGVVTKAGKGHTAGARRVLRRGALGLFVVGIILLMTGVLRTSEKKIDYLEKRKAWREAEHKTRTLPVAIANTQAEIDKALAAGKKTTDLELGLAYDRSQLKTWQEILPEVRKAYEDEWAIFPPVPYGYDDSIPQDQHLPMGSFDHGETHVLGTERIGRDIFSRILYGTRISLTIGIFAVSIYITIGTILGALAGYFGGRTDLVIMRIVETVICIPGLFLMLTIVAFFEKRSIWLIMFAIGVVAWTGITRLVRGEFMRERNKEYVDAARSMGYSTPRIIFRHVLPNALGPVLVAAAFGIPGAILAESGLSFLGLGDPSVPSWGRLLFDARTQEYWALIVPPAVAIFVTVTALNLVGDGLRDALDPKLRN